MYKPKGKSPIPSPLPPQRSSSPLVGQSLTRPQTSNCSSTIDLRQFNDYLQERIARSSKRKELEMSRRQSSQKKNLQHVPSGDITPTKQLLKGYNFENSKESRIKKSREIPSNKATWRKHQSIENLLNKENYLLEQNRKTQCQNQQALRELERKYQELQEKYKLLAKQASQNARAFEKDKKELNKLKQLHEEDQDVLSSLKKELNLLQKNMNFEGRSQSNQKSALKIKSQTNIPMAQSKSYSSQKMWESKQLEDSKVIETPIKNQRYKTSQNWANLEKRALFQSQEKQKSPYTRYYSSQKQLDAARKTTKTRKSSDHIYDGGKSNIKVQDSMKGSRIGPTKPLTETCIRLDNDFSKSGTPTLQKKMIGPKQYSKYRFQPSYKLS